MTILVAISMALAQAASPAAPLPAAAALAEFERLKGLVGNWRGRRPDGREIGVSYRLSAAGSVLVETWSLGSGRESMTLYHMDGPALIATHYCPQGNQPTLRLVRAHDRRLDFTFQSATGLDPGEAYQHDFWIEISTRGTLTRSETYFEGDRASSEAISYERLPES